MSAMEQMVRTVLKAMNLDVVAIQKEVTSRIEMFEGNVSTLNSTLISMLQTQERIEFNLRRMMEANGMEYLQPPASKEKTNGTQHRGSVPTIT